MIGLMVQELGQVEIPSSQRSTFAGTEQSFRSLCELCHWAATVVWSQPEQFRWLALGSLLVVGTSVVLFGSWSRLTPDRNLKENYEVVAMDDLRDSVLHG
jgi:iron-regulated transporter 1